MNREYVVAVVVVVVMVLMVVLFPQHVNVQECSCLVIFQGHVLKSRQWWRRFGLWWQGSSFEFQGRITLVTATCIITITYVYWHQPVSTSCWEWHLRFWLFFQISTIMFILLIVSLVDFILFKCCIYCMVI
jgi:hypothetical protein